MRFLHRGRVLLRFRLRTLVVVVVSGVSVMFAFLFRERVVEFGKVTDQAGDHQLVLRFVDVGRLIEGMDKAYDFYSLDWENNRPRP